MDRGHRNVFVLLILAAGLASAADDAYRLQVEKDRRETDDLLKSALAVVGRFVVQEGNSTLGSDPASTLVLPSKAPKHVGTIHRQGSQFSFQVSPETQVTLNGKPASGSFSFQAAAYPKRSDGIGFGDFGFAITPSGDQFDLRVWDRYSPYVTAFKGTTWFPIDPVYRVEAQFKPADNEKTHRLALTDGASTLYKVAGEVVFQLNGQTVQMEVLSSPYYEKTLFIMFRDETSGKETYAGGRSVELETTPDGKTVLDFNKAENPYCAYTSYSTCAITPRENRLTFPVRAGETYTGSSEAH